MTDFDPVALAAELIRCPSITPQDAGALDVLEARLAALGFRCTRLKFGEVDNLYARLGSGSPHLCFAGHTDVVPVGDPAEWSGDPFSGEVRDGKLWGRGAADMKGAIAAFVAAVAARLDGAGAPDGSVSFLITGDEEGPAIDGTIKVLDWIKEQGETIDDCLIGEPTNPDRLGEAIKIGRRGSVNITATVNGMAGHAAHPHRADNPVRRLVHIMSAMTNAEIDVQESAHFSPTNLEVTSVDVGNPAPNVIPSKATARFNIRYNDGWTPETIADWVKKNLAAADPEADIDITFEHTGTAFLCAPGALVEQLSAAVAEVTGTTPELSTSGGTSDGRFIKDAARVAEFGLVGATMHKVDEHVAVEDIRKLCTIYEKLLAAYFASSASAG